MMLLEGDGQPVFVETAAREVYDVTGAGDTVIAALAGALACGATNSNAAIESVRRMWDAGRGARGVKLQRPSPCPEPRVPSPEPLIVVGT